MKTIYKLFFVKGKPYITIDEDVKIGDKAIVSVNDLYPTFVECMNDEQISLFQNPRTSSTKRYKIVHDESNFKFDEELIDKLNGSETPTLISIENNQIVVIDEN